MKKRFDCWLNHGEFHTFDVKAINWTTQDLNVVLEGGDYPHHERHDRWWCKNCGCFWLAIYVADGTTVHRDYGHTERYRQALICTDHPKDTYGPRVPWPCDAVTRLSNLDQAI